MGVNQSIRPVVDLVKISRSSKNKNRSKKGLNAKQIDFRSISEEVFMKKKHFPFVDKERGLIYANDRRIDCKVPKDIYKIFEQTCKEIGVSPSWVIGKYILDIVSYRIELMTVEDFEG
jgi:hypothetical protein